MHLSLGFILLLVSSITLALSVSHPKSNKPVAKPTGCQKSDSPFYEFLVVTVEDDMEFTFAIRTPYTNYYPDTLDKALRLDGFQTENLRTWDACGWNKAKTVRSNDWTLPGPPRGDVYWKYRDLHWIESKDPKVASDWTANSPDHKPPRIGAMPTEQTLERIAYVLEDNEPAADVYFVATLCLSYLSALLGMIVLMHILARYATPRRKAAAQKDPEGIELAVIKVNSLNKPWPSSASADTLATVRRSDESARVSNASGQSTPLPVYSLNGASSEIRVHGVRDPDDDGGPSIPPPGYPAERIAHSPRSGNAVSRLKEAYGINGSNGNRFY
jgi:hypothetical protein